MQSKGRWRSAIILPKILLVVVGSLVGRKAHLSAHKTRIHKNDDRVQLLLGFLPLVQLHQQAGQQPDNLCAPYGGDFAAIGS